jgi:hypothetical protein
MHRYHLPNSQYTSEVQIPPSHLTVYISYADMTHPPYHIHTPELQIPHCHLTVVYIWGTDTTKPFNKAFSVWFTTGDNVLHEAWVNPSGTFNHYELGGCVEVMDRKSWKYSIRPLPTQCCWQFIYGLLKKLLDGDMMTGCSLVDGLHLVNVFVQFQHVLLSYLLNLLHGAESFLRS